MSDGEESGDDKFRGVCKHGVEQTRTWRGPVRDSYADAQQDIDITIKPMVIHAITALCFSLAILITTTIDHSKMFSV